MQDNGRTKIRIDRRVEERLADALWRHHHDQPTAVVSIGIHDTVIAYVANVIEAHVLRAGEHITRNTLNAIMPQR